MDPLVLTNKDVQRRCRGVAAELGHVAAPGVWGVPRGGAVPAAILSQMMGLTLLDAPQAGCIVVDDLVDSGGTLAAVTERNPSATTVALWRKSWSPPTRCSELVPDDRWLVFPWEHEELHGPTDAVVRLLSFIGEDPTRDGLVDTPGRVVRAYQEMTEGYSTDVAELLGVTFDVACDELVLVTGIEFVSLCEHHLLPFTGTATVGYLPGDRVVGLSKLARLVDAFAHRLQVQERLTNEIATAVEEHLAPEGVGVVVRAQHGCMTCRGVRKANAVMVTSAMRGALRDNARTRSEFLALAGV